MARDGPSHADVQVAIALSLLLSELATAPFNQLICTFSATPQLHRVTGETLAERSVRRALLPCPMSPSEQIVTPLACTSKQCTATDVHVDGKSR